MKLKYKLIGLPLLAGVAAFAIIFFRNSSAVHYDQAIKAPVPAANIPYRDYFISNDSAAIIASPTGTRLKIGPSTFKTKDGSPVKGKIKLQLREFHNAGDILRAGIPMSIDSSRQQFLQSAGMIDLKAYSDNKELEINQNKSIDVDLAGFKDSKEYGLYYLDENKNWVSPGTFVQNKNVARDSGLQVLDQRAASLERPDSSKMVFELAPNLLDAPQLKSFRGSRWKLIKKYRTPETAEAMRILWDDVIIKLVNKRRNIYEMVFSKSLYIESYSKTSTRKYSIQCTPFAKGIGSADLSADLEEQMIAYQNAIKQIAEEKIRLAREADLVNCFKINRMGIYNVDKLLDSANQLIASVSFDFEKDLDPLINKIDLFVVYTDDNSVICYKPYDWSKIRIPLQKNVQLIAVLPHNQIAIVSDPGLLVKQQAGRRKYYFPTIKVAADNFLNSGMMLAKN